MATAPDLHSVSIEDADTRCVVEHHDRQALSLLVIGDGSTRVITWQSKAAALMDAARIVQAVIRNTK